MCGLDATQFFMAPELVWQAALKMTGVNLLLLTDFDMHPFVEKGLRGGIAMISKRYANANNPFFVNPLTILCIWMPTICMDGP